MSNRENPNLAYMYLSIRLLVSVVLTIDLSCVFCFVLEGFCSSVASGTGSKSTVIRCVFCCDEGIG